MKIVVTVKQVPDPNGAQALEPDNTIARDREVVLDPGDEYGIEEGLQLKEFFLLLSSTGLAYRRCELAWVNGDQIGVNFLRPGEKKKKTARRGSPQAAEV